MDGGVESRAAKWYLHNFFGVPFAGNRAPVIFVGNQEDVRRRSSFTVLGLYHPQTGDVEQTTPLF
jgi:hypothetical protein